MAASLEGLSPNVPLYKVTEGNEPCFFTTFFSWDSTRATVCVFLTRSFYFMLELLLLQIIVRSLSSSSATNYEKLYSQLVYAKWTILRKCIAHGLNQCNCIVDDEMFECESDGEPVEDYMTI